MTNLYADKFVKDALLDKNLHFYRNWYIVRHEITVPRFGNFSRTDKSIVKIKNFMPLINILLASSYRFLMDCW